MMMMPKRCLVNKTLLKRDLSKSQTPLELAHLVSTQSWKKRSKGRKN
mgnify:CR=1 FL=1